MLSNLLYCKICMHRASALDWTFAYAMFVTDPSVHFSFSSGRAVGRQKSHLKIRKDVLIQLGFDDHFSVSGGQSQVGCNWKFQFTPGSRWAHSFLWLLHHLIEGCAQMVISVSTVWLKYGRSLCRRLFMYVKKNHHGLNSHIGLSILLTHKIFWQFMRPTRCWSSSANWAAAVVSSF